MSLNGISNGVHASINTRNRADIIKWRKRILLELRARPTQQTRKRLLSLFNEIKTSLNIRNKNITRTRTRARKITNNNIPGFNNLNNKIRILNNKIRLLNIRISRTRDRNTKISLIKQRDALKYRLNTARRQIVQHNTHNLFKKVISKTAPKTKISKTAPKTKNNLKITAGNEKTINFINNGFEKELGFTSWQIEEIKKVETELGLPKGIMSSIATIETYFKKTCGISGCGPVQLTTAAFGDNNNVYKRGFLNKKGLTDVNRWTSGHKAVLYGAIHLVTRFEARKNNKNALKPDGYSFKTQITSYSAARAAIRYLAVKKINVSIGYIKKIQQRILSDKKYRKLAYNITYYNGSTHKFKYALSVLAVQKLVTEFNSKK